MPNAPKTPSRNVRIPDDMWEAAKDKASDEDTSVSEVIRTLLARWLGR